jgi:hypothetical protein
VTLPDARACAEVDASLFDDGRLEGRVVDVKGRPLAGLTLEVAQAGGGTRRMVTDRDGRYAMARIPAGRFTLSVPPAPLADVRSRVIFPGRSASPTATRIALAQGERKQLSDFVIPADRAFVVLSGVVLDAGGVPAEGARVFLKGASEDDRIVSEPVIADFMGRFAIAARAGIEYGLFAERPRPGGRVSGVDATSTHRVTAADGLAPVRLVLAPRY